MSVEVLKLQGRVGGRGTAELEREGELAHPQEHRLNSMEERKVAEGSGGRGGILNGSSRENGGRGASGRPGEGGGGENELQRHSTTGTGSQDQDDIKTEACPRGGEGGSDGGEGEKQRVNGVGDKEDQDQRGRNAGWGGRMEVMRGDGTCRKAGGKNGVGLGRQPNHLHSHSEPLYKKDSLHPPTPRRPKDIEVSCVCVQCCQLHASHTMFFCFSVYRHGIVLLARAASTWMFLRTEMPVCKLKPTNFILFFQVQVMCG